jgi:hypothetical protein
MTIPREKIKMEFKFLYVPETFNTTFFRSNWNDEQPNMHIWMS